MASKFSLKTFVVVIIIITIIIISTFVTRVVVIFLRPFLTLHCHTELQNLRSTIPTYYSHDMVGMLIKLTKDSRRPRKYYYGSKKCHYVNVIL